jgi:hypothetical protein
VKWRAVIGGGFWSPVHRQIWRSQKFENGEEAKIYRHMQLKERAKISFTAKYGKEIL